PKTRWHTIDSASVLSYRCLIKGAYLMRINSVTLRRINMMMKHPFTTSFGTMQQKDFLLATVTDDDGNEGWGESVAFTAPWYSEETTETTIHMLRDFLIPAVLGKSIEHPDEVTGLF